MMRGVSEHPWTAMYNRTLGWCVHDGGRGDGIVCDFFISSNGKSKAANAKLIAAAPELYMSLIACVEVLKHGRTCTIKDKIVSKAENAIAKAEGKINE